MDAVSGLTSCLLVVTTSLQCYMIKAFNRITKRNNNEEATTSIKFDLLGNLPQEIVQKILFHLSPEDLRSATSCSLSWRAAIGNDYFWKTLCQRDGYFEVEEWKRSEFYTNFLKRHSNYWQGVYWYNHTLQRNWETDNYKEVNYEIKEPNYFVNWFLFDDVFAYRKVNGNKLYVYNLNTTTKEFKPTVFSMREDFHLDGPDISKSGKYLMHFISEKCLRVWDLENGSIVLDKFWNHVSHIHAYRNLIVLVTWKEKFEVYNIETGKIEYEFKEIFTNVFIMDGRIVFTTADHVIHILKWDDKSWIRLMCCNESKDHKLLIKNDLLLSFCKKNGLPDITLCVWNISSMTKLHSTLLGRLCDLQSVSFVNKYLYFKRYNIDGDLMIELWDYMKKTLIASIKHLYSNLKVSNDHIMVASRSSKLSIWCLRTRAFICDINLTLDSYEYNHDINISQTKVAYVNQKDPFILLYVRDFEI